MRSVLHRADSRGYFDHGWLKTWHTFSFADYHDPQRLHFGKLRVLNDDIIDPGEGFGLHPHENMEIVTVPLEGRLSHTDSAGHEQVIAPNEVQIMSAGTGIWHSEANYSADEQVRLLQIWVLPDKNGHEARYAQKAFDPAERMNAFQTLVEPDGDGLWLNQQVVFSRIDLENTSTEYQLRNAAHGVYVFMISGHAVVNDEPLGARDGLGVWDAEKISLTTKSAADILLIEIPMH